MGTGVTSFDAATGVQLDSTLTETTAPGAAIGTLGALTRITGTLDCGNEQRGTSNVVVTGMSALGQLSGALTEFRVLCTVTTSGTYVNVNGLSLAGSTPVLVFVTASASLLQVVVETKVVADGYSSKDQGLVTLAPRRCPDIGRRDRDGESGGDPAYAPCRGQRHLRDDDQPVAAARARPC